MATSEQPTSNGAASPPQGLRSQLKTLIAKAARPALADMRTELGLVRADVRSLYAELAAQRHGRGEGAVGPVFAVWRGGLDGSAVTLGGQPVGTLTFKYRDELTFWDGFVKGGARQQLGRDFDDIYGEWQRGRMAELADFLGLGGLEQLAPWCASRTALEVGPGPYPSIAVCRWKRAVAVDPLADGYVQQGLLPKNAHVDEVTFLGSPGEFVPLPGGFADIVVMENCLDHVDNPAAVLREARRLLQPGGLLWLLVDLMTYSDHLHPNPFSEQSIRALLTQEGFSAVRDRVSDHKSHPQAYGEYRGLLRTGGA